MFSDSSLVPEQAVFVYQGDDLNSSLQFVDENDEPLNFVGHVFKLQVRTAEAKPVVLELSEALGTISKDTDTGTVYFIVPSTLTAAIKAGEYVYDLQSTDSSGKKKTHIKGTFTVEPQITV